MMVPQFSSFEAMMTFWGKTVLTFSLAWILTACSGGEEGPRDGISQSARAPSAGATFVDLRGRPVRLSDFSGQRVFLNYWATWCSPCIKEIPSIARAREALEDEGFVFLLASDESIEQIQDFVADYALDGSFIKLNGNFASHGVEAVPSTLVYGSDGELAGRWLGAYEWDSPEILEELRRIP